MHRIPVIDSHTGGEPTRVVLGGMPDLGSGPLAERARVFDRDHSALQRALICEPRGSEILVGALLLEPGDPANTAAVIFFNNAGCLGMCGHGMIGLAATLAHLGRIAPGRHRIETPVGVVPFDLDADGRVALRNVPAYRKAAAVEVDIPGHGKIHGDVVWGGNWFFLVRDESLPLDPSHAEMLRSHCLDARAAVRAAGFPEVDHVGFFGAPRDPANHSRNFLLCPGGAFDRSPCGTGTSAWLACMAADGSWAPGAVWRQESVTGSVFEAWYEPAENATIHPYIAGRAWITAESQLLLDPTDPLTPQVATDADP